jgi:hypothetical protein
VLQEITVKTRRAAPPLSWGNRHALTDMRTPVARND